MFRAVDLVMLTFSPETDPNVFRSQRILGVKMRGEVTKRRTLSANNTHLWVN